MQDEPYYPDAETSTTFRDGVEFQDFVCVQLAKRGLIIQNFSSKKYQFEVGENVQGIEIKLDNRCTGTGRLSIEVAEKSRASIETWTPSGILRMDNSWLYVQGNSEVIFVFARKWLQQYLEEEKPDVGDRCPTLRSFFLPLHIARKYAALVVDLVAREEQGRMPDIHINSVDPEKVIAMREHLAKLRSTPL